MRIRYLAVAITALGAITLAACGSNGSPSASSTPATPVVSTATAGLAVKSGTTSLGTVLVDSSGRTIYGLMKDSATNSTCTGACAQTWPPVLVKKGWTAAPGLAGANFSTIVRADGSRQLVAGQWPLYTFSGDAKPGDVNGEGSGGVWFAVGTNAKFVKSAPSSPPTTMMASGYGY